MSLANADELAEILSERARLGRVFARHAYGMQAWVDLFSPRVAEIREPEVKELVARLVADNARHMLLFRRRSVAHFAELLAVYRGAAEDDEDRTTIDAVAADVRSMRAELAPLAAAAAPLA